MDQESAHMVAASKVLMLKPGVETIMPPTIVEEKAKKRLEMKAIEKRFGGNAATKKTQKNLLKHQYENFTASSSKSLDQTFDKLQKFISQLEILGEQLSQEDVNQKFLRSLTNEAVNTTHDVSTASTQANTANSPNVNNLSDDVIYAFLASQPRSSQLVNEDLKQIHSDDLEEMDLKWQMAMLRIRARRFLKKTRKKMTINGDKNRLSSCLFRT
uniref:Uncharacterized protein n=1 Tax=Tanacetum cinerariifolium TaxID=118510 RepID=A0A699HH68_TANCI|nr:hypothetical protein [Tanacetum cinerariifolium]